MYIQDPNLVITMATYIFINTGSGNRLSHAITWTDDDLLPNTLQETYFNKTLFEIQKFSIKKMHYKCHLQTASHLFGTQLTLLRGVVTQAMFMIPAYLQCIPTTPGFPFQVAYIIGPTLRTLHHPANPHQFTAVLTEERFPQYLWQQMAWCPASMEII